MVRLKGKRGNILVIVLLVGMACVGLVASLNLARSVGQHAKILSTIEQSKIANHGLNENILKLRNFLLQTYDPLVRDSEKLRQLCLEMHSGADYEILRKAGAKAALIDVCEKVNAKVQLVENYKTEHSRLRNSIKYLPSLISQFEKSQLRRQTAEIFSDLLLFNLQPSAGTRTKVERELRDLPPSELVNSLNWHALAVLNQSSARNEIEGRILSGELKRKIDRLENNYLENYQVSQQHQLIYHYVLIAICFFLAVWLVQVFRRLHLAGQMLEEKVRRRTSELSEAMSKLEKNQQLLLQSTKMTALGEMAGGIAHEINTPLTAILMNTDCLREDIEDKNEAQIAKRLETITKIVARVSKIIQGLKRFSRSTDQAERSVVSVQMIIDDTLTLCSEKMTANSVDVQIDLPDADVSLHCVPEHISQVLLNFLSNSLDAMKETVPDGRWIRIGATTLDGHLYLSVTDAGGGLPESVQAKLMQPFFTTKPPGVGTGLGLSISRGIVEDHGGKIYYDKECPNTRFVMRFPSQAA